SPPPDPPPQHPKSKPLKPAFARAKRPRRNCAHVTISKNFPPVFPTDYRDGVRASPWLRAQAGFGGAEGEGCTLFPGSPSKPKEAAMHTTPDTTELSLRDLQQVMIRVQIKALETLERLMDDQKLTGDEK